LIVVGTILAFPVLGYAQEATLTGTVTDSTGGVLPGVTVTAVHETTGTTFLAVTDERGAFRIPARVGAFRITGELPGFTTITRTGVGLLLAQIATVNLEMAPSTVQETVTVTGEAPLVDTTSSALAGNIDPRQMEELPVAGRNWMDLSLLAPGSRGNAATTVPQDRQGYFQINLDGQQVTNMICCAANQPKFSRDSIAEFQLVTNRFDATQGRTMGMMVNAITKSGTNTNTGTLAGYFRDDRFNAADFIQKRVLPYSNQQVSTTFGGPIRQDRIHFFANYEYERSPSTVTFSSPYPSFNIDLSGTRVEHVGSGRVDVQFTPRTRLAVRGTGYDQFIPVQATGGAQNHPSTSQTHTRDSSQVLGTLTQVFGDRMLNELKVGGTFLRWDFVTDVTWQGGDFPIRKMPLGHGGSYRYVLLGYNIGTAGNLPQELGQKRYTIRDDLSRSFTRAGTHDLKVGGEFIWHQSDISWCVTCNGQMDLRGGPIPANIESLFPVWNDASTWNTAPLSRLAIRHDESFGRGGNFFFSNRLNMFGAWAQDNWKVTPRLTLNLGVRWDYSHGGLGEFVPFEPWRSGHDPSDVDNIATRLGFAYSLNDRTVVRGGYGKFFTELELDPPMQTILWTTRIIPDVPYDGRADFAVNPFNGPAPTFEQLLLNACDQNGRRPGCILRNITVEVPSPETQVSFSHQGGIGVQRQLGNTMAFTVDYAFTGGRFDETRHNVNLSYNPATGANYPFRDVSRRPFPEWGPMYMEFMNAWSNYHGLETSFTKRMSNGWQASATYALSGFRDSGGFNGGSAPRAIDFVNGRPVERALGFDVARDLGPDYGLTPTDQRHRATFNGIWDVGHGLQVSGLYFFGSGERFSTSYGADLRNLQVGGSLRLRPNGTIAPRAGLVGRPIHRVDLRLQQRVALGGKRSIAPMLEIFNLFNHENYGSYVTQESSRSYGQPQFNANVAYQPRVIQIGVRLAF
jgi:hypothetical protein